MSGGLLSSLVLSSSVISTIMSGANPPEPPVINTKTSQVVTDNADSSTKDDFQEKINELLLKDRNTTADVVNAQGSITGIDMASHQHKYDFDLKTIYNANEGGQKFAFIKATEGTYYKNPYFREDAVSLIEQKIPIGFYHYAKPSGNTEDAKKQAKAFVKVTGMAQGVKGFDPVLDIEENNGISPTDLINWTEAYVNEIKLLTGRDVMIYTYPNFWRTKMNNTTKFSDLKLWIADYNGKATPNTLPGGWKEWTFWQYTDSAKVEGSEKPVDGNIFNGKEEDLQKIYK